MDTGPGKTPTTLFDRIARQIADTAAELPAETPDARDASGPSGASPRPAATGSGDAPEHGSDDSSPGGVLLHRSAGWPAPDISTQMERPIIAERQCSRSGCSDAAAVTLSFHYGSSQVWIDHLTPEREPHMYDMCDRHSARLSVPRGWHLEDRRGARRGALIAV